MSISNQKLMLRDFAEKHGMFQYEYYVAVSYTHLDVYKRQGYGLRGSDARTEIEHTKEADTPGEIPGRSGLQADRRT